MKINAKTDSHCARWATTREYITDKCAMIHLSMYQNSIEKKQQQQQPPNKWYTEYCGVCWYTGIICSHRGFMRGCCANQYVCVYMCVVGFIFLLAQFLSRTNEWEQVHSRPARKNREQSIQIQFRTGQNKK